MPPGRPPSLLARFFALPRAERSLLIEAWWRLLHARRALYFAPQKAIARAMAAPAPSTTSGEPKELVPVALALSQAVARAASHHVRGMTCLPRSLALHRMLSVRGFAPAMRIGVRRNDGSVTAHAWIEVDGRSVGEPDEIDRRFLPLVESKS